MLPMPTLTLYTPQRSAAQPQAEFFAPVFLPISASAKLKLRALSHSRTRQKGHLGRQKRTASVALVMVWEALHAAAAQLQDCSS